MTVKETSPRSVLDSSDSSGTGTVLDDEDKGRLTQLLNDTHSCPQTKEQGEASCVLSPAKKSVRTWAEGGSETQKTPKRSPAARTNSKGSPSRRSSRSNGHTASASSSTKSPGPSKRGSRTSGKSKSPHTPKGNSRSAAQPRKSAPPKLGILDQSYDSDDSANGPDYRWDQPHQRNSRRHRGSMDIKSEHIPRRSVRGSSHHRSSPMESKSGHRSSKRSSPASSHKRNSEGSKRGQSPRRGIDSSTSQRKLNRSKSDGMEQRPSMPKLNRSKSLVEGPSTPKARRAPGRSNSEIGKMYMGDRRADGRGNRRSTLQRGESCRMPDSMHATPFRRTFSQSGMNARRSIRGKRSIVVRTQSVGGQDSTESTPTRPALQRTLSSCDGVGERISRRGRRPAVRKLSWETSPNEGSSRSEHERTRRGRRSTLQSTRSQGDETGEDASGRTDRHDCSRRGRRSTLKSTHSRADVSISTSPRDTQGFPESNLHQDNSVEDVSGRRGRLAAMRQQHRRSTIEKQSENADSLEGQEGIPDGALRGWWAAMQWQNTNPEDDGLGRSEVSQRGRRATTMLGFPRESDQAEGTMSGWWAAMQNSTHAAQSEDGTEASAEATAMLDGTTVLKRAQSEGTPTSDPSISNASRRGRRTTLHQLSVHDTNKGLDRSRRGGRRSSFQRAKSQGSIPPQSLLSPNRSKGTDSSIQGHSDREPSVRRGRRSTLKRTNCQSSGAVDRSEEGPTSSPHRIPRSERQSGGRSSPRKRTSLSEESRDDAPLSQLRARGRMSYTAASGGVVGMGDVVQASENEAILQRCETYGSYNPFKRWNSGTEHLDEDDEEGISSSELKSSESQKELQEEEVIQSTEDLVSTGKCSHSDLDDSEPENCLPKKVPIMMFPTFSGIGTLAA